VRVFLSSTFVQGAAKVRLGAVSLSFNVLDFLLCPLQISLDIFGRFDAACEICLRCRESLLDESLKLHQLACFRVQFTGAGKLSLLHFQRFLKLTFEPVWRGSCPQGVDCRHSGDGRSCTPADQRWKRQMSLHSHWCLQRSSQKCR
jgi:hypothetical protein